MWSCKKTQFRTQEIEIYSEFGNKDEDEPEDEVQGEGETFVTSAHCRADELFESSLGANCNGGIENQ